MFAWVPLEMNGHMPPVTGLRSWSKILAWRILVFVVALRKKIVLTI